MDSTCVFCQIATGTAANNLYQDDCVVAFNDLHPIAPVHILVVPRKHIVSLEEITGEDVGLLGHMVLITKQLAQLEGIDKTGYRLVINTGRHAGQSVMHLHLHLVGGRYLPFRFE